MDRKKMLAIVEQYCRKLHSFYEDIKITRIADRKTMLVELNRNSRRDVLLTEIY